MRLLLHRNRRECETIAIVVLSIDVESVVKCSPPGGNSPDIELQCILSNAPFAGGIYDS